MACQKWPDYMIPFICKVQNRKGWVLKEKGKRGMCWERNNN
jgi:hypothetical protein